MAHKLGAFHHLPHGIANAVILTRVMRYNAAEAPVKMGTFSQYPYPNALHNYAEMAKYCGIEGKDDKEVFENFITKLEEPGTSSASRRPSPTTVLTSSTSSTPSTK